MIKLIAIDMDGTLLNSKKELLKGVRGTHSIDKNAE